ncbi:MAG: GNAT family N-acetyltransferase [Actinomycetota bacterium]|nr:GNAT family N-acetyltransferase [Actinomycetota bacterium]
MTDVMFGLRPATSSDVEFLWGTQHRALGDFIAVEFGTSVTEQRAFFDEHFDVDAHEIVLNEGEEIGFLFYEERSDHLYLGNIALVPQYRRRGIGSAILAKIIDEAETAGLPIRLQVLKPNPARQFYEKRGFVVIDETDHHFQMIRHHRI